jgi:hypothetical protein
MQYCGRLPGPK